MLIHSWHTMLDMSKKDLEWHKADILEEFQELKQAKGFLHRWSEISDVAYTYTRAKWTGHKVERPINLIQFNLGLIYMFPKYTLRWSFYRQIGKKFDKKINQVRNPKKLEKLRIIAERYQINPDDFLEEVNKKMKYWVFLK